MCFGRHIGCLFQSHQLRRVPRNDETLRASRLRDVLRDAQLGGLKCISICGWWSTTAAMASIVHRFGSATRDAGRCSFSAGRSHRSWCCGDDERQRLLPDSARRTLDTMAADGACARPLSGASAAGLSQVCDGWAFVLFLLSAGAIAESESVVLPSAPRS